MRTGGSSVAQQARVVITGLGAVAPNGIGKEAYWDALTSGRSGIDRITHFDASSFPSQIAGEVKGFQPTAYINPHEVKRLSRAAQLGVAAVKMSIKDTGIVVTSQNESKIGVGFSTSLGKAEAYETDHLPFLNRGMRGIAPSTAGAIPPHSVSSQVAVALGVSGLCFTLSTGCTSGVDVVQWGYQQICLGQAPVVVVGSTEALLNPFTFSAICAVGVLSKRNDEPQRASRPFERDRDGLVLSEGREPLSWRHLHMPNNDRRRSMLRYSAVPMGGREKISNVIFKARAWPK